MPSKPQAGTTAIRMHLIQPIDPPSVLLYIANPFIHHDSTLDPQLFSGFTLYNPSMEITMVPFPGFPPGRHHSEPLDRR